MLISWSLRSAKVGPYLHLPADSPQVNLQGGNARRAREENPNTVDANSAETTSRGREAEEPTPFFRESVLLPNGVKSNQGTSHEGIVDSVTLTTALAPILFSLLFENPAFSRHRPRASRQPPPLQPSLWTVFVWIGNSAIT